jgi:hypothetical protein
MKSIYLPLVFFAFLLNLSCGQASVSKKEPPKPQVAEIKFQSEKLEAGISDGKTNVHIDFRFTNTGTIPLVINEVRGNCHCVQGTKPDKPIAPGDSSVISVSFDPAGVSGTYMRTLMVQSNATRPSIELYVMGDIQRDPKEKVVKTH